MQRNTYIPAERQKKMVEYIESNTSAQIHDLSAYFGVSEATVRRDLDDLDRQGAIRRTHGGAIKLDRSTSFEQMYNEKLSFCTEEKRRIAEAAADMVHDGDTVFIDAGTTTLQLALALSHKEHLTLITNDLHIAYAVPAHPTSSIICTGGVRRQGRQELIGSVAEEFIRDSHVNLAFLGADAVDLNLGVTIANFEEVGVKRMLVRSSLRTVLVADHTKFGSVALVKVCDVADCAAIVTDTGISEVAAQKFHRTRIELFLA